MQLSGSEEDSRLVAQAALQTFVRCASKGMSNQREAMAAKAMAIRQACRLHLDSSILEANLFSEALDAPAMLHCCSVSTAPVKR